MYLICFGTRPELIKLIPLINVLKKNNEINNIENEKDILKNNINVIK